MSNLLARWGIRSNFVAAAVGWGLSAGGYNDAMKIVDGFLHLRLKTFTRTNTPPGSPAAGDAYVVGSSPTGAWATGFTGAIAVWNANTSAWNAIVPRYGVIAYAEDTLETRVYRNVPSVGDRFQYAENERPLVTMTSYFAGTPGAGIVIAEFVVPGTTTETFEFFPGSQIRPRTRPSVNTTFIINSLSLAGATTEVATCTLTNAANVNVLAAHASNRPAGGSVLRVTAPAALNGAADFFITLALRRVQPSG